MAFCLPFLLYSVTLAPTVTLEDSGELICAAYNLGVPHEPGYPLFTMLGKLFTLLPIGTVALRVNLMSAFFTALASVFVFLASVLVIERVGEASSFIKKIPEGCGRLLALFAGLAAALLFGTASSPWEQAVIAEVYGLNSCLVGLFLFLLQLLTRQRDERKKLNILYSISAVTGLALTAHSTSAMLIPLFGLYCLAAERKLLTNYVALLKAAGCFFLGLLPLAYLPLAASRNPIINWGDPGNFVDFMRVITRHQYGQSQWTFDGFLAQSRVFFTELLTQQWVPIVLLFAVAGMVAIFKRNKPFFWFSICFLLFSMPITTAMTNFDVSSPAVAFEHKALVSVFYIPAYLFLSILMGTGFFFAGALFPANPRVIRIGAILFPLAAFSLSALPNFSKENMHGYYCGQAYANNILKTLPRRFPYSGFDHRD